MPSGIIDPTLPSFSPRAVPDGYASCTDALNTALGLSRDTGRPVLLRPGRYLVDDTLDVGGATLFGYYRAPFQPRRPWETIRRPARDPRTRIIVADRGVVGAFQDGVIVAHGGGATRLAGFELVCEERPASFTKADYLHEVASAGPSIYRVDQGIHIVSNSSLVRDVQVTGAGRVCWNIEAQGARFENVGAYYAKGDGFWLENANGCSLNSVQVRYCEGTTPIFVRGMSYNTGFSIHERTADADDDKDHDHYHAAGGCELRTVNVAHCPNAVAQLRILGTRSPVLVSGGWFEGNGGDGFLIERAIGARIKDVQMNGLPPHVAVHIKGTTKCWCNLVEGLLVANRAYAQIKIERIITVVGPGPTMERVNELDEWQPDLGAPLYSSAWYSKSNRYLDPAAPDEKGLPINWYGP